METKLVSIKEAAKLFGFPVNKLYEKVKNGEVPCIEMENLSGTISRKINTKVFAEWLDNAARERKRM